MDWYGMEPTGRTGSNPQYLSRVLDTKVELRPWSGLSQILHADLHWLDVTDWVRYKLGVTIHRCLHHKSPRYLVDCCVPVSDIASRQRLRSARRCLLAVPRHRRNPDENPDENARRPGILSRRTHCLELASRPTQSLRLHLVHIPAVTEDILFQPVLACCSALEVLRLICAI